MTDENPAFSKKDSGVFLSFRGDIMERTFLIETEAIRVEQRPPALVTQVDFLKEYDFFIFSLPSSKLLKIAKFLSRKDSPIGIQRVHKEDRDKEIGQFITSEHPFFPNSIIINIPIEFDQTFYDVEHKKLKLNVQENSSYIIDGQHRLKAFASRFSNGIDHNLVVTAYFGLEPPTIAEIFTRINYFQKPVSKSLVYDLLDLNKDPDFIKYHEAHYIVNRLNNDLNSPFYGMVKMLGIGSGLISQAAFVESLTTRYKILDLIDTRCTQDEKVSILNSYFSAIRGVFPKKWGNPDSILTRSVGFNALVKILNKILSYDKQHLSVDFSKYAQALRNIDVDSPEIKAFGGFKGVNTLADKFVELLLKNGLLR